MSQFRVYLTAALVAGIVATLATGGPAIAHGVQHALFAHNAGKVDGKNAVGASASTQARKGKLVATSPSTGRLPNNIIQQAPDAALLDGLDSTAFLAAGAKAADAELLDGVDSTAFVQGGGTVARQHVNLLNPGQTVTHVTALATVTYSCPATLGNPGSVSVENEVGGAAPLWIDNGASVSFTRLGTGSAVAATDAAGDHLTIGGLFSLVPVRSIRIDVFSVHDLAFQVCSVHFVSMTN